MADTSRAEKLIGIYAELLQTVGTFPSGELYALTMAYGVTLGMHQTVLAILIARKKIVVKSHVIYWQGGAAC